MKTLATYPSSRMTILIMAQSCYYLTTAVWPLIHIESFMWITGEKTDVWLVKTVGALLIPISLTLGMYTILRTDQRPALLLGMMSAFSFTVIDLYYSLTGVISKVYLVDGLVQVLILIVWIRIASARDITTAWPASHESLETRVNK